MCGIAGFLELRPSGFSDLTLTDMSRVMAHRGPDAEGFFREAGVHLAHRRLAIVDLSELGKQPMANEDGRFRIVYNGEIFNHASLRPELERRGHRYRSHSDTETILHAYEQYGPGCLHRFRGMFAFALWDSLERRLFCARDRLGKKPFYYYHQDGLFAFSSEIKSLLAHPDIHPALNEDVLAEYLQFGYVSGEQTLFRDIRKLPPGHWLRVGGPENEFRVERYWNLPEAPSSPVSRPDEEWVNETRQRLEESVQLRLMSDVPLGVFLSGGVDSSVIAALVKKFTDTPVKTFAVGYDEAAYSELGYAREVARTIGTDHHEVKVTLAGFFNALPRVVWHEDEPVAWPSSVSLHYLAELARRQVVVVLTGEGSDELFAGYGRYRHYLRDARWLNAWECLPGPLRHGLRSLIGTAPIGGELRRKLQHTIFGRETSFESIYLDNYYGAFSAAECAALFSRVPGLAARHDGYLRHWNERPDAMLLDRLLFADQRTYLVELLMKQDQMSMSHSIESRVPFLDHEFAEFASAVPAHLKIRDGEGKWVLKKAAAGLIPDSIIYRRKMGFPTPLKDWLRDPRAGALLDRLRSPNGLVARYVERQPLETLLERHRQGQEDGTDRIWRLLNLQLWGDLFLDGQSAIREEGLIPEAMASQ